MEDKNEKKFQIKNKKRFAIICAVALVIIIAIILCVVLGDNNKRVIKTATNDIDMENLENVVIEDGKKVNNSEEMKMMKHTGELAFEVIELYATSTESKFVLQVTNESDAEFAGSEVKIIFLEKEGRVYGEVESYVGKVNPGKSIKVEVTTTLDIANAYDYMVEVYNANI